MRITIFDFNFQIKKKLAWRMIDRKMVVLKNVFVVFDSVERHLVEKYFAIWKKVSASDCKWTGEDEVFVKKN